MQNESDPAGPGLSSDTPRDPAQGHPMLIYWKVLPGSAFWGSSAF